LRTICAHLVTSRNNAYSGHATRADFLTATLSLINAWFLSHIAHPDKTNAAIA
jgi:hypothetical protein